MLVKHIPVGIYIFKVKNLNTRKRCEICPMLALGTPEQHHPCRSVILMKLQSNLIKITLLHKWWRSSTFIVNFWTYFNSCSSISTVDFEQAYAYLGTLKLVHYEHGCKIIKTEALSESVNSKLQVNATPRCNNSVH